MPSAPLDAGLIGAGSPLAFVLHSWPWRESSLVVELFTATHGRVAAIAKGARRPHSPVRGMLQPFLPLSLRLNGKSALKTLGKLEPQPPFYGLPPARLQAGFYLNELLLALLPHHLVDTAVFAAYCVCLAQLRHGHSETAALRCFEKRLLQASGSAPRFDQAESGPVEAEVCYQLSDGQGWVAVADDDDEGEGLRFSGASLLAIAQERFDGEGPAGAKTDRAAIKRVLQHLLARLDPLVGSRSRQVSRELAVLAGRLPVLP